MAPGVYSTNPTKHTLQPIVTGATVLGMKYKDGVVVAADTLASYGNQARYKNVCRLKKVGKYTILGASGEISDFQYLGDLLDELDDEDFLHEDSCFMGPQEYSSYIGRVMYNRRSKMNPLYNQFIIAGKKRDGPSQLSFVDHQGTAFQEDFIATGFGSHLALPIMRNEWREGITLDEAKALIIKCLKVCFYRDCHAYNKIQIATCDGQSLEVSDPITMDHFWGHALWLEKRLEQNTRGTADTW
mmetsp:Transcript_73957/g.171576  ORF Transcript_73957/g.171576 Transcript_73957/m.171576 type:complete len:243 (+) Transcript_73957:84-812(+)|eukprot:CAMPEP_0171090636 /NCGR_PEP_ID=MMETSP0766_2-20121228/31977_1 /TAXON_ID=439317 /ORGANISM="Gambierdiscus australes, Strain CAWD 149" /LENGTH=242 /DNA_ID=CAMNT_0011548649 /DNA_START=83 /DNA_END=811 /DNA_ORIENTATION=-